MIKKIKNMLRPSARKQMTKSVLKDPSVEHAFVKLPRKRLIDVSKNNSLNSVTTDLKKINKYLKKHNADKRRLTYIHTHTHEKGKCNLPSFIDICSSIDQGYNHISIFSGKREIGRITYKFYPTPVIRKEINNLLNIKRKALSKLIDLNSKNILPQEEFKKLVDTYNKYFYTEIEICFKNKLSKCQEENQNKSIIDIYKDMGLTLKFIPNKKYGYVYDYKKLEFVKK